MAINETYDELVQRAKDAQDYERRELFDDLLKRFEHAAIKWAYAILGDEELARDALQEASLSAFLHLDQLQDDKAFPAWFRQIVSTACHRLIRREKPLADLHDHEPIHPDPSHEIEESERRENISKAVFELPERERVVAEMFYFADYSQAEIATVLAVPLTTVKKRLQYAREHLRHLIHEDMVMLLPGYVYALNGGCTGAALGMNGFFTADFIEFPTYNDEYYPAPIYAERAY
jgi:RNA polymerase sigma factor (sigma-70 family)